MDKRFDWYAEIKTDLLDSYIHKLLQYLDDNRSARGQNPAQLEDTRSKEYKATKQIITALYGCYFVIPKGSSKVSISLTASHYSSQNTSPGAIKNYTSRTIVKVIDALKDLSWIDYTTGYEVRGLTRIWAINQLSLFFDTIGLQWLPQEPNDPDKLVALRNYTNPKGLTKKDKGKKINLPVPDTEEVSKYRSSLYSYNKFLTQHCISLALKDDQLVSLAQKMSERSQDEKRIWTTEDEERIAYLDLSRIQLRRIFSRGSMTKGGRFYGGWWQSIPSIYRGHITIDEMKTCEVDYSSMCLRIIYARRGQQIPVDVDLYDIGLPDWKGNDDPRRKPIKTYINAILNDESGRCKRHPKPATICRIVKIA